ncbi:MAG: polyribonucleotide nucleotidyltransferase [Alphaproteobacteria bacterium RIFCSPLOWO2_01_FULL_40_26]|nr:MAG: polyribonucleotide nucleotidyltransferase [Alphaproteobacteria bacterium RIFCSPHIGHO2_02_FULL_40_34]OFW94995.1 MAG: polyribonucleotide nucleotidyltransferase [Alphaproteobacteria bacterium RIFCSPLOWO2_01_FULL_40_26]OFX10557.1 MAG: polyribonucleotide nucleotidyltransferase [Alphaproteobacteria bacterium RIFCSPLOWO2_02_FULL_40_19]OFX12078.1 MAG: polyribonucleotide nucleotidyltransferase [Alphaproteobacteria bacterium RIFCSPLOWO2_12_FULL_40_11]
MFNVVKKEIEWNGKILSLETGKIARQAGGSVVAKYGNTTVLCAVTVAQKPLDGVDFLPLTVNYIEKYYAGGKIPGGFFKREAKPSDVATLTSRLIDRPIRPLFPSNFYNEVNVVCTLLSYDAACTPDIVALIGASAALAISEAPFLEPIAGIRVGFVNDQFVINPSAEELKNSRLDLIVAGTESSVLMIESEAKELTESQMLDAVNFGHQAFQPIIAMIKDLKSAAGKKKIAVPQNDNSALKNDIANFIGDRLIAAYKKQEKQVRVSELDQIFSDVKAKFINEEKGVDENKIKSIFKILSQEIVRNDVLKHGTRIDGRKTDQIRPIVVETGILPQVHGCALFTRGETQALVVATLGSNKDRQLIEDLDPGMREEGFMLHYNFPPYSVGEVGQLRAPGRREIGHGKLAWRALNPVMPSGENFSYSIRVVSEITESNGSSSMATVCGTSLALMDAGVPIKAPVSGIAMGLIKEGSNYVILSDIMGDEDHLGDMDFKVAGTSNGITSLQMDIKINGITAEIMQRALEQANAGRMHILGKMNEVMSQPRSELNANVPKVEIITIPQKKIRDVIGSRGAVIKEICAVSGATVDIEDSGVIKVSASSSEAIKRAMAMIRDITFEPEIGDIYEGPVVKVIDAGAFISISNNRDGFVHISELAEYRVDFVEDIINEGDIVKVKVIGFDKKGRPKLSYRCVDQATGEDISDRLQNKPQYVDERESGGREDRRGGRDRDRGDRDRSDRPDRGDREDRRDRRDRDDRRGDRRDRGDHRDRGGDREEAPRKRRGFFS